jgi:hypothetical protein
MSCTRISLSRDLPVAIDTVVSPHGWRIQIFVRRGGNKSKLRDLLQHLEIPFEENGRFTHPDHFTYDEELNRISPILQNIVDKLATSQELKA